MTITGLNLFQKLFGLTRLSNASPFAQQETETEEVSQILITTEIIQKYSLHILKNK